MTVKFFKLIFFASLFFHSIIGRAEIFNDMIFGSSLEKLKTQFPNAQFNDIKVAWAEPDEKFFQMEGQGISGKIYILVDCFDRFYKKDIEDAEETLNSVTNESTRYELNRKIMQAKLNLSRRIDERLILKKVRWVPPNPLPITTVEKKYGKPQKIVQSDTTLEMLLIWNRGIQAMLSEDEKRITVIDYFPPLKP